MALPLSLRPRLESPLRELLAAAPFLHSLVDALGSPLNVLLPDRIAENAGRFREVYRRHRLAGQVYFAHKANGSHCLVRRLAATAPAVAGVEVASLGELRHVLGCGVTPDRITATGPKDPEFLWLAARTGARVHLDSPTELDQLVHIVRKYSLRRTQVLLRLSEFSPAAVSAGVRRLSRRSRFGIPVQDVGAVLDVVERSADAVELTGVGYHLDTVSIEEKALALETGVTVLDLCRARGMNPRSLDIGGGFGVGYLADAGEWERYTTELAQSVLGNRPALTWRGHGYGLRNEGGTLRGEQSLYPAHRATAGPGYLEELLSHPGPSTGRPLGALLLEHLYDLDCEPGRSLADQCGLSLAKVLEVRRSGRDPGDLLVRLGMNAGDVSLEEHGVLVDPVLVPRDGSRAGNTEEEVGVYLMGNLCLEADLITRRKVFLPRLPCPGDVLAFANTAGYAMDFHAHRAQRQPLARTVAVTGGVDSWQWCLDEQYWPVGPVGGPAA